MVKKGQNLFGPHGSKSAATFLIDDVTSPKPDASGHVAIHEHLVELLDTECWYDSETCQMRRMERVNMVAIATSNVGVNPSISEKLTTRFNISVMSHPTEDSFSKIFSTTLGLAFKVLFRGSSGMIRCRWAFFCTCWL